MADQLADVPTVVSHSSLQQLIAEQIVDIPAPGRAGGRRGVKVFKVYSQDRIQLRLTSSKPFDIPVPRSGSLQGSRPGQGLAASSSHVGAADDAGQWFFRTFPRGKKCGVRSALGVGTECGLFIHPR